MFAQVLLLCGLVMLMGGLVVFLAWKYHNIARARSYIIAAPIMCLFLIVLAGASRQFEAACFGDNTSSCTYNDMVPMIFTAVFIFVSMALIKSYLLFADR